MNRTGLERAGIVVGFLVRGLGWGFLTGFAAGGIVALFAAGVYAAGAGMIWGGFLGVCLGGFDGLVAGFWTLRIGHLEANAYLRSLRIVVTATTAVVAATLNIWVALEHPGARGEAGFIVFFYIPGAVALGIVWFLTPYAARWYLAFRSLPARANEAQSE